MTLDNLKRLKKRLHGKKSETKRQHLEYQEELTGDDKRRENQAYTTRTQAFNEAIEMVEKEIEEKQESREQPEW